MTILITNDDGVRSPGIEALRTAFEDMHDVWVLAPESQRSGMSHYITIHEPLRCTRISERVYSSSGSPADCVILGMLDALPIQPDLVISGINIGPNLGSDIVFSGTAAGARQAAFMGVPGIAVSLDSFSEPFHFDPVTEFLKANLDTLISLWSNDHFININVPNTPELTKPVEITNPCVRIYHDKLVEFSLSQDDRFFLMDGGPVEADLAPGTDWFAVSHGRISVSPIYLNPITSDSSSIYKEAEFGTVTVS